MQDHFLKDTNETIKIIPYEKKQTAQVIKSHSGKITLNIERQSGCSGCQQKNGCTHKQTEDLLGKSITLTLESKQQFTVGQQVDIDIDENTLLFSAFLIYCVPIITLITTALIANFFTQNQALIFISSISFMIATLFIIKKYCENYSNHVLKKIQIKK